MKAPVVFLSTVFLAAIGLFACNIFANQPIKVTQIEPDDWGASLMAGDSTFFLANIYRYKLGARFNQGKNELFVQNSDGEIEQLTFDESRISAIAYAPQTGQLVFAQAQDSDPFWGYLPAINTPGKYSDFRLFSIDTLDEAPAIVPVAHEETDQPWSEIPVLGFDRSGTRLVIQHIYGTDSFQVLSLETGDIDAIVPEFGDFWRYEEDQEYFALKRVDSDRNDIVFDALDGFKSEADLSFLYNEYRLNLDTREVVKVTNTPFYRPEAEQAGSE